MAGPRLSRRALFTGERADPTKRQHHVSSAVVSMMPGRMSSLVELISSMPGVEISAQDGYRIVIVMEAESTGALGGLLTAISALDGLIAANMVFDYVEDLEDSEPWQQN